MVPSERMSPAATSALPVSPKPPVPSTTFSSAGRNFESASANPTETAAKASTPVAMLIQPTPKATCLPNAWRA